MKTTWAQYKAAIINAATGNKKLNRAPVPRAVQLVNQLKELKSRLTPELYMGEVGRAFEALRVAVDSAVEHDFALKSAAASIDVDDKPVDVSKLEWAAVRRSHGHFNRSIEQSLKALSPDGGCPCGNQIPL